MIIHIHQTMMFERWHDFRLIIGYQCLLMFKHSIWQMINEMHILRRIYVQIPNMFTCNVWLKYSNQSLLWRENMKMNEIPIPPFKSLRWTRWRKMPRRILMIWNSELSPCQSIFIRPSIKLHHWGTARVIFRQLKKVIN